MSRIDIVGTGNGGFRFEEWHGPEPVQYGGSEWVRLDPDMIHVFFGKVEEFVPDARGQAAVYKRLLDKLAQTGNIPVIDRVEIPYQTGASEITSQQISDGLDLGNWFAGLSREKQLEVASMVNDAMVENPTQELTESLGNAVKGEGE